MDFIFPHFVYIGRFGQIWEKLQNDRLDLKISILMLVSQIMVFHFVHFEYKNISWHFLVKFIVYRVLFHLAGLTKSNFFY